MKHNNKYSEMLMLYFFDELSEIEINIFKKHLSTCKQCQTELTQMQEMNNVLATEPIETPTKELIEKANLKIMAQINKTTKQSFTIKLKVLFEEFVDSFAQLFTQPRYQLSGMVATMLIGIVVGKIWFNNDIRNNPDMLMSLLSNNSSVASQNSQELNKNLANNMLQSGNIEVADLLSGNTTNKDGVVQVSYKLKRDFEIKGGLDDPTIIDMLRYSAQHDNSDERRMRALNLLANTAKNDELQITLSSVLMHDKNKDIRLKSADLLKEFNLSKKSLEVFKSVVLHDTCPDIRIQAINTLHEKGQEESMGIIALATRDTDKNVRTYAKNVLKNMNKTFKNTEDTK